MYCDICNRTTQIGYANKTRVVNIHGQNILVAYRAEICGYCGEELYDEKQEIEIMKKAIALFRDKNRLMSADRIREYMKKNHITASEMAEKAGLAVETILRAENGEMINKEVSNKLWKAITA